MKRRIFLWLWLIGMLLPLFAFPLTASASGASDLPDAASAGGAILYSPTADQILWEKNPDRPMFPASTVKLMTAVLAIEYFEGQYDREVTLNAEHLHDVSGNKISLKVGEKVTVDQLLNAVVIGGANDAAQALAVEAAGSVVSFVQWMNQRASELGMTETHYTNPTGLHDPMMVTTARDTLTIAAYAYRVNRLMDMARVARYHMEATNLSKDRYIVNKNHLVSTYITDRYYDKTVNGMNFGGTTQAGYCLVASVTRDGLGFIAVVLGAGESETVIPGKDIVGADGSVTHTPDETIVTNLAFGEALGLLKWAMKNYSYRKIVDSSTMVCEIPVRLGSTVDHVTLLPREAVEVFLPSEVDLATEVSYSYVLYEDSLTAPVRSGQEAGVLTLKVRGETVGQVELVAKNSVERSGWLYLGAKIGDLCRTTAFRLVLIAVGAAIVAYVVGVAVWRGRKMKAAEREYYRHTR